MKKIWLLILLSITSSCVFTQKNADLGIFAGASYYLGDLNTSNHFRPLNPAFGLVFRHNFNPRHALRWNLFYGQVSANNPDLDFLYWRDGGTRFKSTVMDMTAQFEFNFLPFKSATHEFQYSTYISGGAGLCMSDKPSGFSYDVVVPFGLGMKFNLTKQIGASISWEFRKTFYDDLDGVNNLNDPEHTFFLHNNDWYNFGGLTLVYKLSGGRQDCPVYRDYNR